MFTIIYSEKLRLYIYLNITAGFRIAAEQTDQLIDQFHEGGAVEKFSPEELGL